MLLDANFPQTVIKKNYLSFPCDRVWDAHLSALGSVLSKDAYEHPSNLPLGFPVQCIWSEAETLGAQHSPWGFPSP